MKNVFFTLFVLVALTVTQAFAYNMKDFTNDAKIMSAMQLLEQSGESEVFANLKRNSVKVKFYNLSGYGNVYATNSYDPSGRRVILINSTYANAPVEQIACLIAHESMHVLKKPTLQEETIATQKEAATWVRLKRASVTYPQSKLTKRLDKLADLHLASRADGQNHIQTKIASSSFYKSQFGI
jgi:hypothetical protein